MMEKLSLSYIGSCMQYESRLKWINMEVLYAVSKRTHGTSLDAILFFSNQNFKVIKVGGTDRQRGM